MKNTRWQKVAMVVNVFVVANATGCIGDQASESMEENVADAVQSMRQIELEENTYYDTYSMSYKPASNACSEWYRGYGCHAITWKASHHNANCISTRPYVTSYPQNTTCSSSFWPSDSCLNQQEANTNIFSPVDPCGGWQYSGASNAGEIAVGAAMAMYHFKTPTYVRMDYDFDNDGFEEIGVAVIEGLTFAVYDTWGYTSLHDLCEFWGFEQKPEPSTGHDIDDVDGDCAFLEDPEFDLTSVQIAFWAASGSNMNRQNRTMSGTQFAYATRWANQYIYDPPTEADSVAFRARTRLMHAKLDDRVNFRAHDNRKIGIRDTRASGWFTPALNVGLR